MSVVVMYCRDPEPQIIEFQTQQYKLFPLLATAYAYWFVGQKLLQVYYAVEDELKGGITVSLPEVGFVADFNFHLIWYMYCQCFNIDGLVSIKSRIQPLKVYF